jgi:hypothetical protein
MRSIAASASARRTNRTAKPVAAAKSGCSARIAEE